MRAPPRDDGHETALAQGVLVTFLWSSAFVLIKVGLHGLAIAPLTFAGLRSTIAGLVLLPLALRGLGRARPDRRSWARAAAFGLLLYGAAQGAQYLALGPLPAAAVSLVLGASPVAAFAWLAVRGADRATPLQAAGIFVLLVGAALYLVPLPLAAGAPLGLAIAAVGLAASAASALVGRRGAGEATERLGGIPPGTAFPMLLGGLVLLAAGVATSGPPRLDGSGWTIVGCLAIVNTAVALLLWDRATRTLTATESNVLGASTVAQVAFLAWVFLGEALSARQLLGVALATCGVAIVQVGPAVLRRAREPR